LHGNRTKNIDLLLQQKQSAKSHNITYEWVSRHQKTAEWTSVTNLLKQNLPRDQIYNFWCDHRAGEAGHITSECPLVAPAEGWAIFASYHTYLKITGPFNQSIQMALAYEGAREYVGENHGLSLALLEKTNPSGLSKNLTRILVHKCMATVKLLHDWQPSYAVLS
jgi:hypothetical protein